MATLSNELQGAITKLQTKHDNLVQAVRDYTGGSVADATNELLGAQASAEDAIDEKESDLLGLIGYNSTTPQPSLILDFENKIYMSGTRRIESGAPLESLVSFSRSSTATYWGADGVLHEAEAGEARFEYDPLTGEASGIVVEGVGENYIPHSHDLEMWTVENSTVSNSGIESPVLGDWVSITEDTSSGQHSIRLLSVPHSIASEGAVLSTYVKAKDSASSGGVYLRLVGVSGDTMTARFVFSDESISFSGEGADGGFKSVGGGVYRVWLSVPTDDDGSFDQVKIGTVNASGQEGYVGDGQSGIFCAGAQLEAGTAPSSLIKTSGSPASRSDDEIYANDLSWLNKSQFSVLMTFVPHRVFTNSFLFAIAPVTSGIGVYARINSTGGLISRAGSLPLSISEGDRVTFCATYDTSGDQMYSSGASVSSSGYEYVSKERFSIGRLRNGSGGSFGMLYGTISKVVVYPKSLTNEEAGVLTS